jgi:hypothetical protein
MRNTADVTGGKPITVLLQSISGVSAKVEERERYSFILSRAPHESKFTTHTNSRIHLKYYYELMKFTKQTVLDVWSGLVVHHTYM